MGDIAIRRARSSDVVAIAELANQLGYEVSPAQVGRWLAAGAEGRAAFVAVLDDEIVGWVQGHDLDLLQYPRVLEIGGLVVAGAVRRRGLGRLLVAAVVDWGRRHGHREVLVRSNITRTGTPDFYESLGFLRTKTSYTFSKRI